MDYRLISIFIPLIVIILAAFTKRVIPSLTIGVITGGIFLAKGSIIQGIILSIEHLIKAVANEDSIYIIFFLFIFGAFGEIMKVSGGIKGFTEFSSKYVKTEKGALGTIWLVTPVTFIDCCFHSIAAGTVSKALIDKVNGSKRKLAFVLNVTSCLLIILIPFGTTYVGYIIGVIGSAFKNAGLTLSPYSIYIKSIPYNFYAIIMILISIGVIIFGLGFDRVIKLNNEKSYLEENGHHHNEAHEQSEFVEKVPPRPINLILPLGILISLTFFFLWYTGRSGENGFITAIINANFEKSIFIAGTVTIIITSIIYVFQKIPMGVIESNFLAGGNEMMPPIVVLILSWGLASIVKDLGFISFVTNVLGPKVPVYLIPAAIFLIGCFASYFMGSAWGTWALIMPIAVPLAVSSNSNLALVIGAVLAGGALGDNTSPLGETAILSSTIAEVPLMEHIKSQLPYSIVGMLISTVLFVLFALI
ncbi:Na+/H+ antiporter NhaC family protein [Clostridium cylindrosporum]|nr:Na+/H+ antiporter NhaC family protein [Clostridium cylindrosporum]